MTCARRRATSAEKGSLPCLEVEDAETPNLLSKARASVRRKAPEMQEEWKLDFFNPDAVEPTSPPKAPKHVPHNTTVSAVYEHQASLSELVIHQKKLAEVEAWFKKFNERAQMGTRDLLLISGPTGSGKTACLSAFCKHYQISVVDGTELVLPAQKPTTARAKATSTFAGRPLILLPLEYDTPVYGKSQPQTPQGPGFQKQLILFDDLPNPIMSEAMSHLLSDEEPDPKPGAGFQVALLLTDPCGHQSFTSDAMMRKILAKPSTTHIVFNPLAISLQKRLAQKWSFTGLTGLQSRSDGDARGLLIDYFFESLAENKDATWKSSRDSSVGLFHALGKILYGKLENVTHQDVSDLTESDRVSFQTFLHENYPDYIRTMEGCALVADAFSFLGAVDWRVRHDHEWYASYAALPERLIYQLAALRPRRGFKSIRAPKFMRIE